MTIGKLECPAETQAIGESFKFKLADGTDSQASCQTRLASQPEPESRVSSRRRAGASDRASGRRSLSRGYWLGDSDSEARTVLLATGSLASGLLAMRTIGRAAAICTVTPAIMIGLHSSTPEPRVGLWLPSAIGRETRTVLLASLAAGLLATVARLGGPADYWPGRCNLQRFLHRA